MTGWYSIVCIYYVLFIHSSTDWISVRLLWVMLQWYCHTDYLFQSLFSLLLGMLLGVELLGHVVILCLAFCGTVRLLCPDHSAPASRSHQQCTTPPIFPHSHQRCHIPFLHFSLFLVSSLEKAVAPHSSTLAWQIPWTEEPGRLQSIELWRVRHNWLTSLSLFTFMHWRRKWQPILVFLPGEFQGWRSLVGCRLWGRTESDMTEAT